MRLVVAAAIGLLALAASSGVQAQPRVRTIRVDSVRDSAVFKLVVRTEELERMIRELAASRELEEHLYRAFRDATTGQRGDERRARELSDSLREIARRSAGLLTTIQLNCRRAQPEGYLGVEFSALLQGRAGPGREFAGTLADWPEVLSVSPGSPAERAGVRAGDRVLAIAGQDARRAVDLADVLRPGERVTLRVRRDQATKELAVTVAKRPADFGPECKSVEMAAGGDFPYRIFVERMPVKTRTEPAPAAFGGLAVVTPPGGFAYAFTSPTSIAGATLMPVDDDWRATLGVDGGLVVNRVLPGTPAREAGLRGSDVIIAADDQPVGSIGALRRIISSASGNSVRLQIVRGGKAQTLTLRWANRP
jgi:predicted metalloprotease with PDZ domain